MIQLSAMVDIDKQSETRPGAETDSTCRVEGAKSTSVSCYINDVSVHRDMQPQIYMRRLQCHHSELTELCVLNGPGRETHRDSSRTYLTKRRWDNQEKTSAREGERREKK